MCKKIFLSYFFSFILIVASHLNAQNSIIKTTMISALARAPFVHSPTLVEITPGHLMASFYAASTWGGKDQKIYSAEYKNNEWNMPQEIASSADVLVARQAVLPNLLSQSAQTPRWDQQAEPQTPCWDPVLFKAPDNSLLLFFKIGDDPLSWTGVLKRSFDGGKTWTLIELLARKGVVGPHKNKPVLLPDGSIICASARGSWQSWSAWIEILQNVNQPHEQWKLVGPFNYQDPTSSIMQPTIFFDGNDNLRMIFRTRNMENLCTSTSSDGGLTWSPVTPIALTSNDSNSDAVTLHDGRVLLAYSSLKPGNRYQLDLACSEDGGQTWRTAFIIEKLDDQTEHVSFPSMIQTSDGFIHIVYAYKQHQIKHVIIDPSLI